MLAHRGFSAWLVSDGGVIQEHLVAVDKENHRVSAWVSGQPGQSFAVYWRDHGSKVDTCAYITLDGFVVPGRFLFGNGIAWRQSVRTGLATQRPFVFAKVEATGYEGSTESTAKDVGMIILRIKQIECVGSKPSSPMRSIPEPNKGNSSPGGLCIAFGDETNTYIQHPTTWSIKRYQKDKAGLGKPSTYVTFVFRYRSHEFLKAQGIISEGPNPHIPRRALMRRVASAPAASNAPMTPSPSLSPKQGGFDLSISPARDLPPQSCINLPTARRAVSMRVIPIQNNGFPGQGLILFGDDTLHQEMAKDGDIVEEQEEMESNG